MAVARIAPMTATTQATSEESRRPWPVNNAIAPIRADLTVKIVIHYPGLEGLDKPLVMVF
jgi:hypothetical protein